MINKRILVSIIIFISTFRVIFSDSYDLTLSSSEGIYFKDQTVLTATAKIQGGWYKIKLNGHTHSKFGVNLSWDKKTHSESCTVTESGTYYASLYKRFLLKYNKEKKKRSITVIKDSTPPTISIRPSISNSTYTQGSVNIKAIVSDSQSGLKSVMYKINNGSYRSGASVTVSSNSTVYFKSIDNVGNVRTVTYQVKNIDKSTPNFNLSSSTNSWTKNSVTIKPQNINTGISGLKSIEFKDKRGYWIKTNNITVSENQNISCRIRNNAGAYGYRNISINNIDKTPAELTFILTPTSFTNGSVKITPKAIDNESGVKSIKLKDENNIYTPVTKIEVNENIILSFLVENQAGITSLIECTVTNIDKTPPKINPTISPSGWSNQDKMIYINPTDNESGLHKTMYSLDNVAWDEGDTFSISKNSNVYLKTKNNAGDWTYKDIKIDNIDKTNPEIVIVEQPVSWTNESKTLSCFSEDFESGIDTTLYSLDNISWIEGDKISVTNNGLVYFKSKNNAGGWSTKTYEVTKIDKSEPILSITSSIPNSQWTDGIITLTAESYDDESGIISTQYSFDNNEWITGNYVKVKENRVVYFKSTNGAGSITSKQFKVDNIDTTEPSLIFKKSIETLTNKDVTITAIGIDKESGIKDIQYLHSDGTWISSDHIIVNVNGDVTFKVQNNSGLWSESNKCYITNIDKLNPVIQFPFIDSNTHVKELLTLKEISSVVSDTNLSEVNYSLDNKAWTNYSNEIDLYPLLDGEHKLKLKASDYAGNTTIKTYNFIKDTKPPQISDFNLNFNKNLSDTKGFSSLEFLKMDVDEPNVESIRYNIEYQNKNVYTYESHAIDKTLSIDLMNFSEGNYLLKVNITDLSGNKSFKVVPFEIDRTKPTSDKINLELFSLRETEKKIYGNEDVSGIINLLMNYTTSNLDIDNPRYKFYISKVEPNNIFNINDNLQLYNNDSTLNFNKGNGLYYIYSFLIDDAGNMSEDFHFRKIRFNNDSIPIPTISGVTEFKEKSDVINYNNPQFLLTPKLTENDGTSIDYGDMKVVAYEYQLFKGTTDDFQSPIYSGEILRENEIVTSLNFTNLADNKINEVYTLFIRAKSNTDRYSIYSPGYKFRIDTKAPEFLEIKSSTHRDRNINYSYNYINFYWDNPWDRSGIEEYKYYLSSDGLNYFIGDSRNIEVQGDRQNLYIPIPEDFDSGAMYLHVDSIDYAGNINTDNSNTLKVNIDKTLPGVKFTSIENNPEKLSTKVLWTSTDNCKNYILSIIKDNNEIFYTLDGNSNSFIFDGLNSSEVYKIKLYGYSNAIDSLIAVDSIEFRVDDQSNSMSISEDVDFTTQFNGFRIDGVKSINNDNSYGTLIIPESLHLYNDSNVLKNIDLNTMTFSSIDDSFLIGINDDLLFRTSINGFKIIGGNSSSIHLDINQGLILNSIILDLDVDLDKSIQIPFNAITVLSANTLDLLGDTSFEEKFDYQTLYLDSDLWLITNISTISMNKNNITLKDGVIDFSQYGNLRINTENNDSILKVGSTIVSSNREFISSNILSNYTLTFGYGINQINIEVLESQLIKNELVIEDALIIFDEDYDVYDINGDITEIHISDLRIGQDGIITKSPFLLESFYINQNENHSFFIESLNFSNDGISINGSVIKDGNIVEGSGFSYLNLTKNGIDDSSEGFLDNDFYFTTRSGFNLYSSALDVKITSKGFLLNKSTIDLSPFDSELSVIINDLLVDFNRLDILEPGYNKLDEILLFEDLVISNLELNNESLISHSSKVLLSDFFETKNIALEKQILKVDNTTNKGYLYKASILDGLNTIKLKSGYNIDFKTGYYENETLNIPSSTIELPKNINYETLELNNIKIDKSGIRYDNMPNIIKFDSNGWMFNIRDPFLSINGLEGITTVDFKINQITESIALDSFILQYDGSYTVPKSVHSKSIIGIFGFSSIVSGISLFNEGADNYIKFDNVVIERRDRSIQIDLSDVLLDSNGNIVSYNVKKIPNNFISNNGFIVEPKNMLLENNSIYLNGSITLPDYLTQEKPIDIELFSIELTPEWNILTKNINETSSLYINGVKIEIKDYLITSEGIFISDSYLLLDNYQRVLIKNSYLGSRGRVLSQGYLENKNSVVNINGWDMVLEDAYYTNKGIEVQSHVQLSESLGTPTLYFSDMRLFKDNLNVEFTTNTTINSLDFTHNDFGFSFDTLSLENDLLSIYNGEINLPNNDLFNGNNILIDYFKVGKDGSFMLNGSQVEPFKIYGLNIFIDGISFNNNKMNISGSVEFPITFGLKELAGKRVSISEFEYNNESKELLFNIELDELTFDIAPGWRTSIYSMSFSSTGIYIDKGNIKIPGNWLENISIEEFDFIGLSYEYVSRDFNIEEILINNIDVNCSGYNFSINSATYSSENGFSFSGEFPLTGLFDGENSPPIINVYNLQINDNFEISKLDAGLSVRDLSITPNKSISYTGDIGIISSGSDFLLSMGGELTFGDNFLIDDLYGNKVSLETFTYDILNNQIVTLNGALSLASKELFSLDITNFIFGIDYTNQSDSMSFNLSGDILLPENYPGIGGETFSLQGEFDTLGNVKELSSGIIINSDRELIQGLILKSGSEITLEPILNKINNSNKLLDIEFSLFNTNLTFSNDFVIENLRGSDLRVNDLVLSSLGKFKSCSILYNTPAEMELYNEVKLLNGNVLLEKEDAENIITRINGDLQLPSSMGNILISITEFSINSLGHIKIDAGASGINTELFEYINLYNGEILVKNGSAKGSLDFSLSGDFKIENSSIPSSITDSSLYGSILYSTDEGIESFYMGLKTGEPLKYSIMDGVNLNLDGLSVSNSGLGSNASLIIEDGFWNQEGETTIQGNILIDWDGNIIESELIVDSFKIKYSGMDCTLSNLKLNNSGFDFESAIMKLPDSIGGQKVGIINGGITSKGEFYGDFVLDTIKIDILGCQLELHNPRLDLNNEEIISDKALFILPETLGGASISVSNIRIGKRGLSINGGEFSLPDIDTGAMKFTNMSASLAIDGDDYVLGATGKVFIAGTGEVEAKISLVNISKPDYPIGVEYAYFSFEAKMGGIPLGSTGLLISGLRGGLAFGPPGDDLPNYLKDKFTNGMRIQLGISIIDASKTVTGRADYWLNVSNLDFALKGDLEFLNGLFKASSTALYTQTYGLELIAGLELSLLDKIILDGMVRAHIFDEDDVAKFCAEARVKVKVQNLLWGFPSTPISLGTLGVEVGDFKDNKQGIKGYITLSLIGTKGFYYGTNGDFKLGNVNSYKLLDRQQPIGRSGNILNSTMSKRLSMVGTRSIKEDSSRERILFCLEFSEGDSQLTLISPSGIRYSEGDNSIVVERINNKILMAVINPENGNWDVEINNISRGSDYTIEAIGFEKNPYIDLNTPKFTKESVKNNYEVTGNYKSYTSETTISLYISKQKGQYNGFEVASFKPSEDSTFNYKLDTSELNSGEYFIYAGIYDGINPEIYNYANGSIIINNDIKKFSRIDDLIVAVSDINSLNISFTDNNKIVKGYYLNSLNLETNKRESLNIGNMTKLTISSFNDSNSYIFSITPYDNNGVLGLESNIVKVDYLVKKETFNKFNINSDDININIGEAQNHILNVEPIDYKNSNGAQDYAELVVKSIPDYITFNIKNNRVKLDKNSEFKLNLICVEYIENNGNRIYTKTGSDIIELEVRNIGNENIYKTLQIPVNITYNNPVIENIYPEAWFPEDGQEVEIKGDNFTNYSRVFIDNIECEILNQNNSTLKVYIPELENDSNGEIKVINPGTEESVKKLNLYKPYFEIKPIKQYTIINKGSTGWLYSEIRGFNRFSANIDQKIISQPEGWNISYKDSVKLKELIFYEIKVPINTKNGKYNIVISSGDIYTTYSVEVTDKYPDPTITNLSSFSGNPGDLVTIYGYGFNPTSSVYYNNHRIDTVIQSQDFIIIHIPNEFKDGIITVKNRDITSNTAEFFIKSNSFNIYTSQSNYNLQPGDSFEQTLYLRGYANNINLEAFSNNEYITIELDKNIISPNDTVKLSVFVSNNIKNGAYRLTVKGSSLTQTKTETINIIIGDNIQIVNKNLDSGRVDEEYKYKLVVENSLGPIVFELPEESYLPDGLYLDNKNGEIYGIPRVSGNFIFKIRATESEFRYSENEFYLTIDDSGWFNKIAPIGNNRFTYISTPSENQIVWDRDTNSNVKYLLSSADKIFVISNDSIISINKNTGQPIYTIDSEIIDVSLKNNYILSLEKRYIKEFDSKINVEEEIFDDTFLVIYDRDTGVEITSYKGVTDFNFIHNKFINRSGVVSSIDTNNYEKSETDLIFKSNTVTTEDGLYYVYGNNIKKYKNGQFNSVIQTDNEINFFTSYLGEYYILDNFGNYSELENNRTINTGISNGKIVVGRDYSIVYNRYKIVIINRANYNVLQKLEEVEELILTNDKLLILNRSGINSYNVYSGNKIWTLEGNYKNLIANGSKIYFSDNNNRVICLGGRANTTSPTTEMILNPSEPNGKNGYYNTRPTLNFKVTDLESYGETFYSINDDNLISFNREHQLPDGQYQIKYFSKDSSGLIEEYKTKSLKVDSIPPISKITKTNDNNRIIIELSSEDVNNDSNDIFYKLNELEGQYIEPIIIKDEGLYTISYWSEDSAGNIEEKRVSNFILDKTPPEVEHKITTYEDDYYISFNANDMISDIDKIEYQINNSIVNKYFTPIKISSGVKYNIKYKATDTSGKSSFWKSIDIDLSNNESNNNYKILSVQTSSRDSFKDFKFDIKPAEPNGNNGYFIDKPVIKSIFKDFEYSINDSDFIPYTEPFILNNGKNIINNSYNENFILTLFVDTEPPKTVNNIIENSSGINIELESNDSISGVYKTYYKINNNVYIYDKAIEIKNEGEYDIEFWSEDIAGNIESPNIINLKIDLYEPNIDYVIDNNKVFLSATDTYSGIDRIEYRIDGSPIKIYKKALDFPEGYFNLLFRAIDKSNKKSNWENIVIDNSSKVKNNLIYNLTGELKIDNENNKLNLHNYLLNGILLKQKNLEIPLKFRTSSIINIFILTKDDSDNFKDWELIETNSEGLKVYKNILTTDSTFLWNRPQDLIIIIKNPKEDLIIFKPNNSLDNWYAATELENEINRRWYYKIDGESWVEISSDFSGEFNFSSIAESDSFEVKVESEIISPISSNIIDNIIRIKRFPNIENGGIN